jgi:hypothetical protein
MPDFLKRAARFRAHAATSLANAEAAGDEASRRAHLAIARHFYSLAEQEISLREAKRPVGVVALGKQALGAAGL